MEEYVSIPEPIYLSSHKMDEYVSTASTLVWTPPYSELSGFSGRKDITMKEIPQPLQLVASAENPCPTTSLQELEQFTLPIAIRAGSPSTEHFIYTSFYPTLPIEGNHA
jgi:hypothetical protein